MARYTLSELADRDLVDTFEYIARDDEEAASRLLQKIKSTLAVIASDPGMGEVRRIGSRVLRRFAFGPYVLYYECDPDGILVVRVLHGARDADPLLG